MVQRNKLREALDAGECVIGARAVTASPVVVDVYGALGLDFVWLDTEHTGYSPYDSIALNRLVRAARAADVEPFVRIGDADPAMVRNVLDAGVGTILLPRIETAAQTGAVMKAARYVYDGGPGERGVGSCLANDWGAGMDGYAERSDEAVLAGILVETAAAVENIEEIVAVPGIDFAFLGPVDLSVSMGYPMAPDEPAVQRAIERVRAACSDADVPIGEMVSDTGSIERVIEDGTRILRLADDVRAVRETVAAQLDVARDTTG